MEEDIELQSARDEALRAIGRNLLLFQRAELMLKRLNTTGSFTSRAGEAQEMFAERKALFDKQTLGQQLKHLQETHFAERDPFKGPIEEADDDIVTIGFDFSLNESDPEARELAQDNLVKERNHLAHQMFAEFDSDSLEQCREMLVKLDEQRESILPEFRRIVRDVETVREGIECITAFYNSPEGRADLSLPHLRKSPVVKALIELAPANAQPDGWTPLRSVAEQIDFKVPGSITKQVGEFASKSLCGLILTSRLFELKSEPTESGGTRALYRVKEGSSQFDSTQATYDASEYTLAP